jgi:cellulose synthase (UDP-forming)
MVWNALNVVIAGAALGVVAERRELRRAQRLDIQRHGLLLSGGAEVPVIIEDVSRGGARVRTVGGGLPIRREGETIGTLVVDQVSGELTVRSLSVVVRRINADGENDLYGLQFMQTSPAQMRLVADLMYADFLVLDRHRQGRRKKKSVFAGTLLFVAWGVRYSLRACGIALKPKKKIVKEAPRSKEQPADLKKPAHPAAELAARAHEAHAAPERDAAQAETDARQRAAS